LRLQDVSLGFTPEHLLTLQISLPKDEAQDMTRSTNFFREVIERVLVLPGVQAAGVATALPVMELGIRSSLSIEGRTDPSPGQPPRLANNRVVSPGYFRALGIPRIEGRLLSTQDSAETLPVVVINRAMAKRYWRDENPVGKRFRLRANGTPPSWLMIVGVVGDIHQGGLDTAPVPEFYTPFTQDYFPFAAPSVLFVRSDGDPQNLIPAVRDEIGAVDKSLPVSEIQTMEDVLANWLAPRRFNLLLMSVFAAVALTLAAVGIYGVVSYSVSQRTRELGVRVALGAQRRDLLALVIRQGLVLAVTGVVMGLVVSFGLTRWLATLLFGISANDPFTLASVASLFTLVALFACYFPARRAMKVDPMIALRYE
jgi:putative ABC transport system permease protein